MFFHLENIMLIMKRVIAGLFYYTTLDLSTWVHLINWELIFCVNRITLCLTILFIFFPQQRKIKPSFCISHLQYFPSEFSEKQNALICPKAHLFDC